LKRLEQILRGVEISEIIGVQQRNVRDIHIDSRKVNENSLFLAVPGIQADGHDFINEATEKGASVIVCERLPENLDGQVTYVVLEDIRKMLSGIVSNFFEHPDKKMTLIGVTGTNGKTTIATLLYNLAIKIGKKAGLISTIEYKINEESFPSTHTTPDILSLMRMFSKMVENGCSYVFMEVSSHAVEQGRVEGLDFDGAVFSNITRDHLDYHKTFKNYINAKKKFFDNLKIEAFALINIDDVNGKVMVQNSRSKIKTYSFDTLADFKGKILGISLMGLDLKFNEKEAHFKLTGKFNAYNLLAVFGASVMMGWNEEEVLVALSGLEPIEGRSCMSRRK
jgi:UDP-N-acetylmuramoyl-L-alanyl-D-glutamate--2,6-diaminopimelate ligase